MQEKQPRGVNKNILARCGCIVLAGCLSTGLIGALFAIDGGGPKNPPGSACADGREMYGFEDQSLAYINQVEFAPNPLDRFRSAQPIVDLNGVGIPFAVQFIGPQYWGTYMGMPHMPADTWRDTSSADGTVRLQVGNTPVNIFPLPADTNLQSCGVDTNGDLIPDEYYFK